MKILANPLKTSSLILWCSIYNRNVTVHSRLRTLACVLKLSSEGGKKLSSPDNNKMAALIDAINAFLNSGENRHILAAIKGGRNGIVYGAKIRFPHALVMTFLFKRGPLLSMLRDILSATYTHSRNLGLFVLTYKGLTSSLSWGESKSHQIHNFLSAFCAGFVIFGKYNKINEQINLYLLSRVIYAVAKLLVKRGVIPQPQTDIFPWFAAIMWGLTLWLFEYDRASLQPSLASSMTYLYKDSDKWDSLRNFLIHNK